MTSRPGDGRAPVGDEPDKGRTYAQLYNEARQLGIEGRSAMRKDALERAVNRRKR